MHRLDPIAAPDPSSDAYELDLHEVEASIALVATGAVSSVVIVGLREPEAVAGAGAALAQQAAVGFSMSHDSEGRATVTISRRQSPRTR